MSRPYTYLVFDKSFASYQLLALTAYYLKDQMIFNDIQSHLTYWVAFHYLTGTLHVNEPQAII